MSHQKLHVAYMHIMWSRVFMGNYPLQYDFVEKMEEHVNLFLYCWVIYFFQIFPLNFALLSIIFVECTGWFTP